MAQSYDLIVIGAGPGGYVGAIRASQLGMKVAVIEKDKPGGVCLNIGCIPSKTLINEANQFATIPRLKEVGIKIDTQEFDYKKVFKKSRNAADTLSSGVNYLLKKNKINLISGTGVLSAQGEVTVDGSDTYQAKNILLATGSRPREIPGFKFDETDVLSSTGALLMESLPKSILILGGGAIGVEFAHILNAFGVRVHIVEMLERILPLEDAETAQVLHKSFTGRGIAIDTSVKATAMKRSRGKLSVSFESKDGATSTKSYDKILVVTGRVPNTGDIGLDKLGIAADQGFIVAGDYYQTSVPGIYACGDMLPSPMLAHVASKEAEIAVEHMAGKHTPAAIDPATIPGAVYCEPQVASFGMTEEQVKERNIDYKKAVFPYRGAGKSVAIGHTEGIVKIIYGPAHGELLGCHLAGAEATELIHEVLLAKTAELLPEDVATMIHAHPTLSEAVMEAARTAEGWAIHA
ncbi:MAG: dihydrolipoyl dehydrogenase [Chitinivibrionales bacterium]|nr:dihydrolipoyl dehydrogenase [Chitinivibrionales bacterium]